MPIHGTDDTRQEVLSPAAPEKIRTEWDIYLLFSLHKSIAVLVNKSRLQPVGDVYTIQPNCLDLEQSLLESQELQPVSSVDKTINFLDQKCLGTLTAFVVQGGMMVTSGHAALNERKEDIEIGKFVNNTLVVFGWEAAPDGTKPNSFNKDQVFEIAEVLVLKREKPDYCIFRTTTPIDVMRFPPLDLLPSDNLTVFTKGDAIITAGCPDGLPMKVAEGKIKSYALNAAQQPWQYLASVFRGCSGSPIFSVKDGSISPFVIGMVEAGEKDFQAVNEQVQVVKLTGDVDGESQEEATRMEAIRWALDRQASVTITIICERPARNRTPPTLVVSFKGKQLGSIVFKGNASPQGFITVSTATLMELNIAPIEITTLNLRLELPENPDKTNTATEIKLNSVVLRIANPDSEKSTEFIQKGRRALRNTITVNPTPLQFPAQILTG
ncbi:hypothetical protein R3P38DRAFT_3206215 [Favolaschia claudopus]|uniref:Serine protease n=1 Tax=Favolaschia claudopus TaxID=2862362 RepID=A0AAW0AKQ6_9AGAR